MEWRFCNDALCFKIGIFRLISEFCDKLQRKRLADMLIVWISYFCCVFCLWGLCIWCGFVGGLDGNVLYVPCKSPVALCCSLMSLMAIGWLPDLTRLHIHIVGSSTCCDFWLEEKIGYPTSKQTPKNKTRTNQSLLLLQSWGRLKDTTAA